MRKRLDDLYTHSECMRTHLQNCHWCGRLSCCDNTTTLSLYQGEVGSCQPLVYDQDGKTISIDDRVYATRDDFDGNWIQNEAEITVTALRWQGFPHDWVIEGYKDDETYFEAWACDCAKIDEQTVKIPQIRNRGYSKELSALFNNMTLHIGRDIDLALADSYRAKHKELIEKYLTPLEEVDHG